MDIDFSMAPEGATHYGIRSDELFFYRIKNSMWEFFIDGEWYVSSGRLGAGSWDTPKEITQQTKEQFIVKASKIFFDADDGNVNDLSFGALYDAGCRFKGV